MTLHHTLTIVGLGPGDAGLLSLQVLRALQQAPTVILRTARHPAADELPHHGVRFTACDDLYDTHTSFEAVYAQIVERVLTAAAAGDVVYAVPGDPLVAERTVYLLLQAAQGRADVQVTVLPALGALNLIIERIGVDPGSGLLIADARAGELRPVGEAPLPEAHAAYHGATPINPGVPTIWFQVDTPLVASNLKILLLEQYPPEHPVTLLTALGTAHAAVTVLPLAEMDRGPALTHLTSLFVPALPWPQRKHTLHDLRALMALLRSDHGCPWDREQDFRSIRRTVVEEAYEVVEAIDRDEPALLADELGDLLLNIVFLAQLGAEEGLFDLDDVLQAISEKIIRRHAHVFGTIEADTAEAVLRSWEQIKAGERVDKGETSIFDDVPQALPALARAQKLQKRAAQVGFDWLDFRGPLAKLHEELEELSQELGIAETWPRPPALADVLTADPEAVRAAGSAPKARLVHELGDLLFAAVNTCRALHLDAEEVMREVNARFVRRFQRVEAEVRKQGNTVKDLPLAELDAIWLAIKGDD